MKTTVVNKRNSNYDVYVGRPTSFGNPWSHNYGTAAKFKVNTREEAIENYRKWIWGEDFTDILQNERWYILNHLGDLRNQRLACWCYPQGCHADILADICNNWDERLES